MVNNKRPEDMACCFVNRFLIVFMKNYNFF